jgi:ribosomal protein S18 acetylase RimI-like enzyme
MMDNVIRDATVGDARVIVELVKELARSMGEESPLIEPYVQIYLDSTSNSILLAMAEDGIIGLLSYSLRPNLYHSGNICLIEELIVGEKARGRGIGARLLVELFSRMTIKDCAEISVSTLPGNQSAIEFYRKHGFKEEGVLLEIHPLRKGSLQ